MTLKMLARDLYNLQKEVELLERQLAAASLDEKPFFEEKLRRSKKERDYLRRALDGRLGR